jgi:hypothetical protein
MKSHHPENKNLIDRLVVLLTALSAVVYIVTSNAIKINIAMLQEYLGKTLHILAK